MSGIHVVKGKKKGETYILKAKSLISGGSPPQCDSGLRKGGVNVCILSRLIASLKSDISACLKAILETSFTVFIKTQVVCYITKVYDGISACTQQS